MNRGLRLLCSIVFISCFVATAFASRTTVSYSNNKKYTCSQWDILDISFAEKAVADPFAIEFGAVFSGPNGESLRVPGFYDGNHSWTLRVSPPLVGEWAFTTYSSLPKLAGKSGTIRATQNSNPTERGPIVLNKDNPQHFYYADGTPYFVLAFEIDWLFALDAQNPDGIPKTESIVSTLAEYGFNQAVMNVYAFDVSWGKDPNLAPEHEFGSPAVFPFGGSNENPEYSTLDVDFFQHFDRVMDELNANGIASHLMIYVWNKLVNWAPANSEADNRYFDYVIARYQAYPNLIWDVSKEALGYGHDDIDYITDRISRIRKLDAYNRLITVHDYHYCSTHPEQVDFISIQSWTTPLYAQMKDIRELYPNQPIFNIEHGGYEESPYVVFPGDYTDPVTCLARNYEIIFAGCYSTYYWQGTSWNVVIPDPFNLPQNQQPHFEYYQHIRTLFNRYNFAQLEPTPGRSSSGLCLSDNHDLFLYYIPAENYAIHVTLPSQVDSPMNATWFRPLTGEFVEQGVSEIRNWHEFKSPWQGEMAVLVLEKE